MKIALSSAGFFPQSFGGGEMYVYRLARELSRRGQEIVVVTNVPWNKGDAYYATDKYTLDGIPVVTYSLNSVKLTASEKDTDFGKVTRQLLREILHITAPDVVHINGIKAALVQICSELEIPYVVTAHHAGIVCPAGGLLRPDGSVCDREITPKNCVPCGNFHRRPKWYTGGLIGRMPSWIYRPLGERLGRAAQLNYLERGLITPWLVEKTMEGKRATLKNARIFIAPSLFMRDLLIRGGCDPEKIVVIPHGIEPVERTPLPSRPGMPVRFGYVGRIDPSKGLHVLLEAAQLLTGSPSCEIHIFGAARNPWDEAYRKKTLHAYKGEAKSIDHGLMPHDRLKEVYAQIDVLVVPSLLPEAFGLVVAEAFSAGRPVIVLNSGALPELVTHGKDGFIVKEKNGKSLASVMQKFIDDPGLIIKMSEQIPHVRTIQEHVDDVEILYRKLVQHSVQATVKKIDRQE